MVGENSIGLTHMWFIKHKKSQNKQIKYLKSSQDSEDIQF